MGLTCCTQRESSQSEYLDSMKEEMDRRFYSNVNIKPLVNMIPEAKTRRIHDGIFKETPRQSIRMVKSQEQIQDKFDLKVDLLLEKLKCDLSTLARNHGAVDVEDQDF